MQGLYDQIKQLYMQPSQGTPLMDTLTGGQQGSPQTEFELLKKDAEAIAAQNIIEKYKQMFSQGKQSGPMMGGGSYGRIPWGPQAPQAPPYAPLVPVMDPFVQQPPWTPPRLNNLGLGGLRR